MNPDNLCHLSGTVDDICWTRYPKGGRGQVRFFLRVNRDLAGEGCDVLLCAIEPRTAAELVRIEAELRPGRTVSLAAEARSLQDWRLPAQESAPGVIFVAECAGFDGAPEHAVHRKPRVCGKMAAAGETEPELLAIGGGA